MPPRPACTAFIKLCPNNPIWDISTISVWRSLWSSESCVFLLLSSSSSCVSQIVRERNSKWQSDKLKEEKRKEEMFEWTGHVFCAGILWLCGQESIVLCAAQQQQHLTSHGKYQLAVCCYPLRGAFFFFVFRCAQCTGARPLSHSVESYLLLLCFRCFLFRSFLALCTVPE